MKDANRFEFNNMWFIAVSAFLLIIWPSISWVAPLDVGLKLLLVIEIIINFSILVAINCLPYYLSAKLAFPKGDVFHLPKKSVDKRIACWSLILCMSHFHIALVLLFRFQQANC
jgi:hypothetical protein